LNEQLNPKLHFYLNEPLKGFGTLVDTFSESTKNREFIEYPFSYSVASFQIALVQQRIALSFLYK